MHHTRGRKATLLHDLGETFRSCSCVIGTLPELRCVIQRFPFVDLDSVTVLCFDHGATSVPSDQELFGITCKRTSSSSLACYSLICLLDRLSRQEDNARLEMACVHL